MAQLKLLIAGLGNPGKQYERNRHNAGFMILDLLAEEWGENLSHSPKDKEVRAKLERNGATIFLLKPLEYMNLSGRAVTEISKKNGISPSNILVAHDEIDFPFGKIKLKQGGGHGGNNGIRDILDKLGSPDFTRLRFGVGKPEDSDLVSGHVLSNFNKEEVEKLPELLEQAKQKILGWIREREALFQKHSDK
ncbi:aminoacyl-tRNA hydrolase [Leptospira perolatii]|uniref:Peptidyl-tRNA hydrolase n=1 Tax=Leptospira perolatii TaxID=2023191 RepID=A0A2M9ZIN2_9LEPT|nr:aminoacyl-tRNA hydrolase [Leptospira perolatii]PJZ68541.1 aminoacyl-tRNA hydrolase [Leptospira perolatii]PJZ71871.1 aminoacyl-tRNA hydrolase [Leptospira perolatii]